MTIFYRYNGKFIADMNQQEFEAACKERGLALDTIGDATRAADFLRLNYQHAPATHDVLRWYRNLPTYWAA